MSSGLFENVIYKMCLQIIYLIYMYKEDFALNNLQCLICHKTKPSLTVNTLLLLVLQCLDPFGQKNYQ